MNDKFVRQITSMDDDFAKWYTDIVLKADLIDYTSVKGFMIIRPYGYAIWENIQKILDSKFKETGHENIYMPLLIPESLLNKEKDHVKGFAPEVAWVTEGGKQKLEERLCIRPTSETLFCDHFQHIIKSYRDLPKLYNQWCNVVRWEKTTRPFLRSREFLWQEGHTMHETQSEAETETINMLNIYKDFCQNCLDLPVISGRKTPSDKFAGAEDTYAIESLTHDGKSLQAGTSHYFGNGFAKAYDITYTDRNNNMQYPYQTSWGVSTRLIGAIIMTHGDNDGLIIPPAIAPIQIVIVPIQMQKSGILEKCKELNNKLISAGYRTKIDASDNSPGWKFSEYEMKGVPIRIEIGPRDLEANKCVLVSRTRREKNIVDFDDITDKVNFFVDQINHDLFDNALKNLKNKSHDCKTLDEVTDALKLGDGYIKAMWCGEPECEEKVKEITGVASRCIPFDQENISDRCVCCGKAAKYMVIWGKSY